MEQDTDTKVASAKSLPSLQTLFADSWKALINGLLNLFLFNLIGYVSVFLLIMVCALIIGLGAGVLSVLGGSPEALTSILTAWSLPVALVALVFTVLIIILALVIQIGSVIIIGNGASQESLSVVFKKSLKLVGPAFLVSLVSVFILWGSTFVFLIPAIIFGLFFCFSFYTLVLDHKSPLDALRSSMALVKNHFWGVLGRLLLIVFLSIMVQLLLQGSIISFILNILISWFSLAYGITLYKQAKAASGANATDSLKLPVIVSLIGWVIAALVGYSIMQFVASGKFTEMFTQNPALLEQQQQILEEEYNFEGDVDVDTNSSIRVE